MEFCNCYGLPAPGPEIGNLQVFYPSTTAPHDMGQSILCKGKKSIGHKFLNHCKMLNLYIQGVRKVTIQSYKLLYSFIVLYVIVFVTI